MKSFCSRQSCSQRRSCSSCLRSSFYALNVKVILLTEKMVKVIWPVKDWQTSPLVRCSFPSCKTSFCSPRSPSRFGRIQPTLDQTVEADWQPETSPPPRRLQPPQCRSRPDPASSQDIFLRLDHCPPPPRFEQSLLFVLPDFSQMLPRSYFWPLSAEDSQS